MALGYPIFGGTNNVPVLDIGQIGGVRHTGGVALFSGNVIDGHDETRTAQHDLPQANKSFIDVLGTSGETVMWKGAIRTSTTAMMITILREIKQRTHGSNRDVYGIRTAANPAMIAPTRLTDSEGNILMGAARVVTFRAAGRRHTGTEWAAIQLVEIVFRG